MSTPPKTPPRFLPTLTEVVVVPEVFQDSRPALLDAEQLVHRVLQRVDLSLETMLRDAIGPLVIDQITAMAYRLRPQVETVVRQAVEDALALEFDTEKIELNKNELDS